MSTDEYLRHRGLVLRIAYDITGSLSEAEDIAQETWLRWHRATEETKVTRPRAYLARVATNLALDALRRRDYPGRFLPEPVPEGDATDSGLVVAEEVSLALALVLQSMSPLERTAFVLHDVFSFSHEEVAEFLGRSPSSVRQLASRARRHIEAGRSRFDVDTEKHHRLTEVFLTACRAGDLESLKNLLTEDVTVFSDGGGRATVAVRPIVGADKVARFFLGLTSKMTGTTTIELTSLNSTPAWIARVDGRVDHVGWPMVTGDGISAFYIVRNPEKLTALGRPQE